MSSPTYLIKRYQNRKFYSITDHRYLQLSEIAGLIKTKTPIQVVENTTNRDITDETAFDAMSTMLRGQLSLSQIETLLAAGN